MDHFCARFGDDANGFVMRDDTVAAVAKGSFWPNLSWSGHQNIHILYSFYHIRQRQVILLNSQQHFRSPVDEIAATMTSLQAL